MVEMSPKPINATATTTRIPIGATSGDHSPKKMRTTILSILLLLALHAEAQRTDYIREDSLFIVRALQEAPEKIGKQQPMLYFGKLFLGHPYVGHTLEKGSTEHLIVNTRELDCTTFVENVTALTLCHNHNERTFKDFCRRLTQLRYRQGHIDGYPSRLHYFTQWGEDNEQMGLVYSVIEKAIKEGNRSDRVPFAKQVININYMSTHPKLYKHLDAHPEFVPIIRKDEQALKGKTYPYLSKAYLGRPHSELPFIETGDIVAIITSKQGLDTSHVGIAVWQNGKLHLMHASSLKKKVVLDTTTFYDYSQKQTSHLGIRLYRLK